MKPKFKVNKIKLITLSTLIFISLSILLLSLPTSAASISEELLKVAKITSVPDATKASYSEKSNSEQSINEQGNAHLVELTASPKQCIAMQQGQSCYLQVNLVLQANSIGDYCLYLTSEQSALQCWQKIKQAKYNAAFESKADLVFVIRDQSATSNLNKPLAQAKVKMAWVHKKKGKPRMSWRLF